MSKQEVEQTCCNCLDTLKPMQIYPFLIRLSLQYSAMKISFRARPTANKGNLCADAACSALAQTAYRSRAAALHKPILLVHEENDPTSHGRYFIN